MKVNRSRRSLMILFPAFAAVLAMIALAHAQPAPNATNAPSPAAVAHAAPAGTIVPVISAAPSATAAPATSAPAEKAEKPGKAEKTEAKDGPEEPEVVTVGMYVYQVPELDLKTNTYVADFYLWLLWKGDLDPSKSFEFMNVIGRSDLSKVATFVDDAGAEKPDELPDGRKIQEYHVQGRFSHAFGLADYPFDEQDMTIEIEDAKNDSKKIVYQADSTASKVHPAVTVPGWVIRALKITNGAAKYETNFGDPRETGGASTFAHMSFSMHVSRPVVSVMAKTILPLFIVLLITFCAMLLKPSDIDARTCLTITALISAVALQYSYMTELPPTGYLVLLDKIYILSYSMILGATAQSIFSYRLCNEEREDEAVKLDVYSLISLTLISIVGGTLIILLR